MKRSSLLVPLYFTLLPIIVLVILYSIKEWSLHPDLNIREKLSLTSYIPIKQFLILITANLIFIGMMSFKIKQELYRLIIKTPLTTALILFGAAGFATEIIWTSFSDAFVFLNHNHLGKGKTFLWMFVIYGVGGAALTKIYPKIKNYYFWIRGLIYVLCIFSWEMITAMLLKISIGYIPWNYSEATSLHFLGAIRLDYAPLWFMFGLLILEKLVSILESPQDEMLQTQVESQ